MAEAVFLAARIARRQNTWIGLSSVGLERRYRVRLSVFHEMKMDLSICSDTALGRLFPTKAQPSVRPAQENEWWPGPVVLLLAFGERRSSYLVKASQAHL